MKYFLTFLTISFISSVSFTQKNLQLVKIINFNNKIADITCDKASNKVLIVEKDKTIWPSKKSGLYYRTLELDLDKLRTVIIDSSKVEMSSIDFNQNQISTADHDGNIKIYNKKDFKLTDSFIGDGDWIYNHKFSTDGKYIYFIKAFDTAAYFWNTIEDKIDSITIGKQINDFILSDNHLVFGNFQKSEIWSENFHVKIQDIPFERVSCLSRTINNYLIGLNDGMIIVTDLRFNIIKEIDTHFKSISCFDSNEKLICSSSSDQSFAIYNIDTLELIHHELNSHRGDVDFSLFTKDYLITFGEDRNLKIWLIK